MTDPITPAAQAAPVESAPTVPDVSTASEPKGNETPAPTAQPAEHMVPYGALKEERRRRQEAERKAAEVEGRKRFEGLEGQEDIMKHPLVQELLLKDAKRELTDFAKDALEKFPNINPQLKKAILANVRGFVKETTTDVESAKLDIQEYVESILEGEPQAPTQAGFPVATTTAAAPKGATPADLQKIFDKPVDEWTAEDQEVIKTARSKETT